ncbi:MAG: hypothetical protein ABSG67_17715 [Thermoguttaceae bacterium]|jgi:hypothetical protein
MAKNIAEAVTKIYQLLKGLDPAERLPAAKAALTMLGQVADGLGGSGLESPAGDFHAKANVWIKRVGLTADELSEMFHMDNGKVELILGKAMGTDKRTQTFNTYLLTGIATFLESGTPDFSDESARAHCKHLGCYDAVNHATTTKKFGNKITGSKASGWKLTAPGLATAASLIKDSQQDSK